MEISSAVIIGTGNVATAMALALDQGGIKLMAVYDRKIEKARILSSRIGLRLNRPEVSASKAIMTTDRLDVLPSDADLYLVSVSDRAIEEVCRALPRVSGIVAHTAGGIAVDALRSDSRGRGVFYPLQTFTTGRAISFRGLPVFVEGSDTETVEALKTLAGKLGAQCFEADSLRRRHIHLAGVFANNFVNLMLGFAGEEIRSAGFSPDVLRPIVMETIAKNFDMGADAAQTGPARRNDRKVMDTHLGLMKDERQRHLYKEISRCIVEKFMH